MARRVLARFAPPNATHLVQPTPLFAVISAPLQRKAIIQYVSSGWPGDVSVYAIAAVVVLPPLVGRIRRKRGRNRQESAHGQ
jgi:hypothetical protein